MDISRQCEGFGLPERTRDRRGCARRWGGGSPGVLAVAALLLAAGPAAGAVTLQVQVASDGEPWFEAGPIELPLISENGTTLIFSAANLPDMGKQSEFVLNGTVTVNTNIYGLGLRVSPNIQVQSTSAQSLEFNITVVWPTGHPGGVNWSTAAAWHRQNSGVLFSLPGSSMWSVGADNVVIDTLFDDPSGTAGAGDAVLTTHPINGQWESFDSTMSVDLAFSLSPGTNMDVTGAMLLTPCDSCTTDSDCNGVVGIEDLLALLAAWGTSTQLFDLAPAGGDGIVDVADLLLLLSSWGPCP